MGDIALDDVDVEDIFGRPAEEFFSNINGGRVKKRPLAEYENATRPLRSSSRRSKENSSIEEGVSLVSCYVCIPFISYDTYPAGG